MLFFLVYGLDWFGMKVYLLILLYCIFLVQNGLVLSPRVVLSSIGVPLHFGLGKMLGNSLIFSS